MQPPSPEKQATASRMKIAIGIAIFSIIATVVFAIFASKSCNDICTVFPYACSDIQCCAFDNCTGCVLTTNSCTGLSIAAGVCGVILLISAVVILVSAYQLNAMERQAIPNASVVAPPHSDVNLVYQNQEPPQYQNNNQPVIYGNNNPNPNHPYQGGYPNQGNYYQPGNNNQMGPQYYNNNQPLNLGGNNQPHQPYQNNPYVLPHNDQVAPQYNYNQP